MPLPKFDELMTPLLELCLDGQSHRTRELVPLVAKKFSLSDEEVNLLNPSGQSTFTNRVWWARSFLVKAEMLEAPSRGVIKITPLGKDLFEKNKKITIDLLKKETNFEENWGRSNAKDEKSQNPEIISSLTPEEMINEGHQQVRENLIDEILTALSNVSPYFFEKIVVDVLIGMGYGGGRKEAGEAIGRSGDGGIDGVINEDKLGLDIIYIQAKHWQNKVGGPEINSFVGSLEANRANKGVFFTTSTFTSQAQEITKKVHKNIVLIDGRMLATLMIDHGIGVSPVSNFEIKRVDSDYFIEE